MWKPKGEALVLPCPAVLYVKRGVPAKDPCVKASVSKVLAYGSSQVNARPNGVLKRVFGTLSG